MVSVVISCFTLVSLLLSLSPTDGLICPHLVDSRISTSYPQSDEECPNGVTLCVSLDGKGTRMQIRKGTEEEVAFDEIAAACDNEDKLCEQFGLTNGCTEIENVKLGSRDFTLTGKFCCSPNGEDLLKMIAVGPILPVF